MICGNQMSMNKKSPITDKTLRHYGQSLDERIDILINEKALPYLIVTTVCFILAGWEWWRYYREAPPSPGTMTLFAVVVAGVSFYKVKKFLKEIRQLRQGREGERAIGQYLEFFREKGCKVFHDIVGEGFNVDHVIIGEKGVFLIETKTYSKPEGKKPIIRYDGHSLIIDGFNDKDRILNQVRAASSWLMNLIKDITGKEYEIKPVVVFPGWFVEQNKKAKTSGIWVLNPKALPAYIEDKKTIFSGDEVSLISYHLSRYVRAKEAELKR